MFNEALLDKLSPEIEELVHKKLDEIDDESLLALVKTFELFPSAERKVKHAEDDEWFVAPKSLQGMPWDGYHLAEGLRMIDWQLLIFEEAKDRGLASNPQFWSKERIQEERSTFIASLRKPVNPNRQIYYNPHEEEEELFPKEKYEISDEDLEFLHEES